MILSVFIPGCRYHWTRTQMCCWFWCLAALGPLNKLSVCYTWQAYWKKKKEMQKKKNSQTAEKFWLHLSCNRSVCVAQVVFFLPKCHWKRIAFVNIQFLQGWWFFYALFLRRVHSIKQKILSADVNWSNRLAHTCSRRCSAINSPTHTCKQLWKVSFLLTKKRCTTDGLCYSAKMQHTHMQVDKWVLAWSHTHLILWQFSGCINIIARS